jgi:hypothetical protein
MKCTKIREGTTTELLVDQPESARGLYKNTSFKTDSIYVVRPREEGMVS